MTVVTASWHFVVNSRDLTFDYVEGRFLEVVRNRGEAIVACRIFGECTPSSELYNISSLHPNTPICYGILKSSRGRGIPGESWKTHCQKPIYHLKRQNG